MPDFQLILSDPKSRRSAKIELKDPRSQFFMGLKIGDTVDASSAGIPAKIKITGGSDRSGTPMRYDVQGSVKKRVLLGSPPGIRVKESGYRKRKLVRGNTISQDVYQINAVLVEGSMPTQAEQQPKEAETKPQKKGQK
jgi:small subunit ribosomal protein S6e